MGERQLYSTEGSSALADSDEVLIGRVSLQGTIRPLLSNVDRQAGINEDYDPGALEQPAATLTAVDELEEAADLADNTPETPEDTAIQPPGTMLEIQVVKDLLTDSKNEGNPDSRIGALLAYAWNTSSLVERTNPAELLAYITDNPADWYTKHLDGIKQLIDERSGLMDIYDRSERYIPSSPFLRNTITIHDIALNRGKNYEGMRVELSARLILLEAEDRRQNALAG